MGSRITSLLVLLLLLITSTVQAQRAVGVALISDGPTSASTQAIEDLLVDELVALTEGEFKLAFTRYNGQWSQQGIVDAFEQAYANPDVDMVLALGFIANQIGVVRKDFAKPTFLPVVPGADLYGVTRDGNSSGKKNLNYISHNIDFAADLQRFKRVAGFSHAVLIGDRIIVDGIPELVETVRKDAESVGVKLSFIGHDGTNHKLADLLPASADAVIFGGLNRMPEQEFNRLIAEINARKIPSFSLLGIDEVRRGVLASDAVDQDYQRLARRNALNMDAVLLGEATSDQPVLFQEKRELSINMETARKIGLSPRFDVLSEAVLLNEEPEASGPTFSLADIAQMAVGRNLNLAASGYNVPISRENVASARSGLLPQLNLSASTLRRRESALVQQGQFAEGSSDYSLGLSQVIYNDDVSAGVTIQENLLISEEQALEQIRLDTIQQATVAFLDVLRAETQLKVAQDNLKLTKTNLQLAENRVSVGSSSAADLYRWQSQMATVRSSLISARAGVDQAREILNRLLHQPITERMQLSTPKSDDPFVWSEEEFDNVITNPRQFERFTQFLVLRGLEEAPELGQLDALISAKQRELLNLKRDFWLPDFSLSGQYQDNIDQSGTGSDIVPSQSDWTVSVTASIPIFAGGRRGAERNRAAIELEQLQAQYAAVAETIEQSIRSSVHGANAAFINIELSQQAAVAAEKNLSLVTDAYAKGAVSIIDLLDAQNSSLQADLNAENAVYDFLVTIMNVQRASAAFDFMLSPAEQQAMAQRMRNHMAANGEQP